MSKDKVKTKPPMPPGPEADGHNLDETVVPRKPMTAEPATEPEELEPEPGEDTGEGGEGSEEPGEGTGEPGEEGTGEPAEEAGEPEED